MKRTIVIDGNEVEMKCTGATPSFYRELFKRDLFIEFAKLSNSFKNGKMTEDIDFSVVENLAYTMAYQADRTIGTKLEWLDSFEHSSAIYDAMEDILALYTDGLQTISEVKKKKDRQNVSLQ